MKKLILILILLPILAKGQFEEYNKANEKNQISVMPKWTPSTTPLGLLFTNGNISIITTADLFEYERYCYNDSIEIITHECPSKIPGCLVYHVNKIMIYREPTFKGFIEWIRKDVESQLNNGLSDSTQIR